MYLARVSVKNFRNLQDFEITLGPGLNVILGANNSGKTNLVDAIRLALGSEGIEDAIRLGRDDWTLKAGVHVSERIRIDLEFTDLDDNEIAQFLDIVAYNSDDPSKSTAAIAFEASWNDDAERASRRRWGGGREQSDAGVPDEVLQSLRTTFLKALRDAETGLSPSRRNRLARLLTRGTNDTEQQSLVDIIKGANKALEDLPLIQRVEKNINAGLGDVTDERFDRTALIRTSEPSFDRTAQGLRLVLRDRKCPTSDPEELGSNGLGYNNLLYTITVLTELANLDSAARPILLIEEPEAHLHPQLQTLLLDYLADTKGSNDEPIQVIVTSHSPTVAAHVSPDTLIVMHPTKDGPRAAAIRNFGLSKRELRELQRMLDVTRASMLFASGVVLVEGVSEELLLPAIASLEGKSLMKGGVSVTPVCGVAFDTIAKLFGTDRILLPVSIVTDADPEKVDAADQTKPYSAPDSAVPKPASDGTPEICARTESLIAQHNVAGSLVRVFHSSVTLEYDLALASLENGEIMARLWKSLYESRDPRSLKVDDVVACTTCTERALKVWRGVCVSQPAMGKPELAMRLADALLNPDEYQPDIDVSGFKVPAYLADAITHVLQTDDQSCQTD